jgi:hypothetical protein
MNIVARRLGVDNKPKYRYRKNKKLTTSTRDNFK